MSTKMIEEALKMLNASVQGRGIVAMVVFEATEELKSIRAAAKDLTSGASLAVGNTKTIEILEALAEESK